MSDEKSEEKKAVVLQATIIKAGTKSANGHIYPKDVIEKGLADALPLVQGGAMLGGMEEVGSSLSLTDVSHVVRGLKLEGDDVQAEVEILPTPKGNALLAYLKSGGDVRMVPRGKGHVEKDGTIREFTLLGVDVIPNNY